MADDKDLYAGAAEAYDRIDDLPYGQLWQEAVKRALGPDCSGQKILDLGGGTGLHARAAIDLGAARVDVLDISPSMLERGQLLERQLGRPAARTRWLRGDAAGPLAAALVPPLEPEGYDVVMTNWVFDHATTDAELEAMWANAAAFCRPGGRLLGMKVANPEVGGSPEYGITMTEVRSVPGGLAYKYTAHTDPLFVCPGSSMQASLEWGKCKALAARHGFDQLATVPEAELDVVKADPAFWQAHVDDPIFVCITATKAF